MIYSLCLCRKNKTKFKEYITFKKDGVFSDFEGIIIGQCVNCGLLKTISSQKNKIFLSSSNHSDFYELHQEKFIKLFIPIVEKIKKYKAKGKILDVGCSLGILLSLLEKEGYDVYGIEPDKAAFEKAKKRLGRKIFNGILKEYLKNHHLKFDVVIYNHVLEHIEKVKEEIKLVKTILKKEGILVVGVPNTANIIFFLRREYWESLMPQEHIWHFNSQYLLDFLKKFNFKIKEVSFSDDQREDYPLAKKIYFRFLSFVNRLFKTGEAVLLIAEKQ